MNVLGRVFHINTFDYSLFIISMHLKTISLISVAHIIKISFWNPNFNDQEDAEI